MMKSLCTLSRRADLDRAGFQTYYEDNHATLAIRHFPFARYVRNHVVSGTDAFDTLSEFWIEDQGVSADLMAGPIGDRMREDEARFMDRSLISPAGAEEHMLSKGVVEGPRVATLLRRSGDEAAFRAVVLEWGKVVATAMPGVSIDFVVPWREPAFPADAVLWSPADPGPPPAALADGLLSIVLRRVETPPGRLLGNAA